MAKLHTHYGAHVADLNACLADNPSPDVRTALSLLHSDGVAQVMSFMRSTPQDKAALTFSAASPQMRLDVDILDMRQQPLQHHAQVRASGQKLLCSVEVPNAKGIYWGQVYSLWWAERHGAAVKLLANNACSVLLQRLSDRLKGRINALHIVVEEATLCARHSSQASKGTNAVCDGQCGTLLCALSTFSNLTSLAIEMEGINPSARVVAAVHRALSVAAGMQISDIEINRAYLTRDFSTMPLPRHLLRLKASECGLRSLAGLEKYSMLTHLDVSENSNLSSFRGLTGLPNLEKVVAKRCGLRSLGGLSQCSQLRELDVSMNLDLRSFRGLNLLPLLWRIEAFFCRLRDVEGLAKAPKLRELDVGYNPDLKDLSGLVDAPSLEKIDALRCNLKHLGDLRQCLQLREVIVSENTGLYDLQGLVGLPRLEIIEAHSCSLVELEGLNRCPRLREVNLSLNPNLRSLRDFAGAPSLVKVVARECGLEDVRGMGTCPQLRELDVASNIYLRSLRGLENAPRLERVMAAQCYLQKEVYSKGRKRRYELVLKSYKDEHSSDRVGNGSTPFTAESILQILDGAGINVPALLHVLFP